MRVGSLFSGIGGLDLGLERAGMSVAWQCERDEYARSILRRHWPDVPCYDDVRDITAGAPAVDLICGGFPCQPASKAGQRKGTEDDRWLWPEVARVVGVLRPRYLLVENVPGLLDVGRGAAFSEILSDLAAVGYDAEWDCLPAAAIGAPHLRDRVFLVAYPHDSRRMDGQARVFTAETWLEAQRQLESGRPLAYPPSVGLEGGSVSVGLHSSSSGERTGEPARSRAGVVTADVDHTDGRRYGAPEVEVRPGRECSELSSWWATEPDVGRVADGIPDRVDRIRTLGNAVVPQVAQWIGERIMNAASQAPEATPPRLSRSGQDEVAVAARVMNGQRTK